VFLIIKPITIYFKHTIQIHFRKNIDQKHIQIDSKYQPLGERLSDGQTDRPLH